MGRHLAKSVKNENGTAIFAALILLVLATGLGLLAFHVSTGELQISAYAGRALASTYLAESGVEKVLSWVTEPARSPDPAFFAELPTRRCAGERTSPDFQLSEAHMDDHGEGPFAEISERGKIVDLRLYKPSHPDGICTIQSGAVAGKGAAKVVQVEIARNPMPPITAAIQGFGETGVSVPVWGHWGPIRYIGGVRLGPRPDRIPTINPILSPHSHPYREEGLNEDPVVEIHTERGITGPPIGRRPNVYENDSAVRLDSFTPNQLTEIKNFIKKRGGYYVVSPSGRLEQNGADRGEFDEVFGNPGGEYALVWIDVLPGYSRSGPIRLGRKNYKGYFYFSEDIHIQEERSQIGMTVQAHAHPWSASHPFPIALDHIRLDGFFFTPGVIDLQGPFSAYGAVYAGQGFTGPGAEHLQVWYNKEFASAHYPNMPPMVRLKGTWRYIPPGM
ncbi:MAG: pilus assembly PilX N-terminal domain-containing protein [Candidatus Manganitrophus sp. SB1]|nr:pilus assembly PilX N-terminal domain-containing protein [Candidatus Manganitrophus morganii]